MHEINFYAIYNTKSEYKRNNFIQTMIETWGELRLRLSPKQALGDGLEAAR